MSDVVRARNLRHGTYAVVVGDPEMWGLNEGDPVVVFHGPGSSYGILSLKTPTSDWCPIPERLMVRPLAPGTTITVAVGGQQP